MEIDPLSRRLLEGPNFAHVATLLRDGGPHTAPIWIQVGEDDRVLFYKEQGSVAYANLQRDPRLALSVLNISNPYENVVARGRVVETRGEPEAREFLRQLAVTYIGELNPESMTPEQGAVFVVELERLRHTRFEMRHAPAGDWPLPGQK
jgi:PPOX class probable F420-dependent enzyme